MILAATCHFLLLFTTLNLRIITAEIHERIYEGCNSDFKFCLPFPEDDKTCIQQRNCMSLATVFKHGDKFIFEMESFKNYSYVAVGLSTDKRMDEDSVMECVKNGDKIELFSSFTEFQKRNRIARREGVPQSTSRLLASEIVNSKIFCRIEREANTTVEGHNFNLNSTNFYLMLASGESVSNNSVNYHLVRAVTDKKVKFTEFVENSEFLNPPEDAIEEKVTKLVKPSFYEGCDETKICFGMPPGCVGDGNCQSVVAVMKQDTKHIFEMQSKINAAYIAVGISLDEFMGDDFVLECVNHKNEIKNYVSYTTTDKMYAIRDNLVQHESKLLTAAIIDSRINCKVEISSVVTSHHFVIDLNKRHYHLMLATGLQVTENSIEKHDQQTVSKSPLNLSIITKVETKSKILIQIHAILMLFAWIGCLGLALTLPRFFRRSWKGKKLFGGSLWFNGHKYLLLTALGIVWIAFVIIVVDIGGISVNSENPHWIFGLLAVVLMTFQSILGFSRPSPLSRYRDKWKISHWILGFLVQILGYFAIIFSASLKKAKIRQNTAISFFFCAPPMIHLIVLCSLIFLKNNVKPYQTLASNTEVADLNRSNIEAREEQRKRNEKFDFAKEVVFYIYCLIIVIYLIIASVILWENS